MKKFTKGTIVFVNTVWFTGEKCEVLDKQTRQDSGQTIYTVHSLDNFGTYGVPEEYIYSSKEEANSAYLRKSAENIQNYRSEIRDLKDLVEFPLKHTLTGEYADTDAAEAYKIRIHELTGYDI